MDKIENNLPKSALALYVKIYLKKQTKNKKGNKTFIEAMKSWLSLSESDREQFLKKYNEYQKKVKMAYAYYLKNAEPYLKVKKKIKSLEKKNIEENTTHSINNVQTMHMDVEQNYQIDLPEDNTNNMEATTSIIPRGDVDDESNIQLPQNRTTDNELTIAEPTPPKLICAEQLFRMIHEGEENNLTWANLTKAQKRRYQNAVLGIKRKYLKDYKNYLEQLPSEKLYYHFINIYHETYVCQ